MKYFIDTNVFLRNLNLNSPQFPFAKKILDSTKAGDINSYTSNIVLSEINWVLKSYYKFSKEEIIMVLDSIQNLNKLKFIDNIDEKKALEIYRKLNIKYVDCQIASILGDDFTIISFDNEFKKINSINYIEATSFVNDYLN